MEEIISHLKTGDVISCSGRRLISRLIKFFTKSEWSHTALYIEIWGQPYIIDSQKDGTNIRPFEKWIEKYNYNFVVHRSPIEFDERIFSIKAISKVGSTPYDFYSLVLRQPWKLLTGKWRYRGTKEKQRMFCSEFVAWVHEFDNFYSMNPKELHDYIVLNEWVEIVRRFR
jgi:uncharacterized protein YycO